MRKINYRREKNKNLEATEKGIIYTYSSLATSMTYFLRPARPNERATRQYFYIERHFQLAGSGAQSRKRGRGSPVLNRRGTPRANLPLPLPLRASRRRRRFFDDAAGW